MLNVFKKLATKGDGPGTVAGSSSQVPGSVGQQMSDSLRKKFSRGVQYNMKVIIKGDRNVGKSCLLERLQGKAFLEQYNPTDQIQVASIQWNFKATDDIVKVEVWDVVDRGKAKQKTGALKLNTDSAVEDIPVLDAEFLDVYKGTHCVIMMMDITKAWTFDYVCRELPKVPADIPVLLLGNHCDMGHHRVITKDQIQGFIEEASQSRTAEIVYGDSSMRNGFGLRLLHKFFGIPFLYLQRSALEASLKKNEQDADICRLEITEFLKSTESDYSNFLENLISRKKTAPHSQSTSAPVTPLEALPRPTKSIILGGGHPIIVPNSNSHLAVASTSSVNTAKLPSPSVKPELRASPGVDALRIPKSATVGAIAAEAGPSSSSSGFVSAGGQQHGSPGGKISNVDEFCPDGGVLDKSFLDDTMEVAVGGQEMGAGMESDSDDDSHHNPLVSRFDDDFGGDGSTAAAEDVPPQPPKHLPLRSTSSSESVPKFNPLRRQDMTPSPNPVVVDRAFSLSSIELEIDQIKSSTPVGGADSGSLNDSESWSLDTKERRSPEGGEDVGSNVSVTCSKSSSGSAKKSKDKDKERSSGSKHKKSKKSSREKDESREERRKSKRSKSHSVVDDFVQQMKSSGDYDGGGGGSIDDAYEAI